MCFYDANEMACKCWKWGKFRQFCVKDSPSGEVCGMKLVMNRYSLPNKCKKCTKIDEKQVIIRQEQDKIRKWRKAADRGESIAKAEEHIRQATTRIENLIQERDEKRNTLA